ncbi:hypothetical protein C8R43DRAFT_588310 [Mycena crocata]|nr:hypothetical protein C8R43DRAFT_588310 [Mycena crocata]
MADIRRELPTLGKHAHPYRASVFDPDVAMREVLRQMLESVQCDHIEVDRQFNLSGEMTEMIDPPPEYSSPTSRPPNFLGGSESQKKTDILRLGIVIRETFQERNYPMSIMPSFQELVDDMLHEDPSLRPGIQEVLARFESICTELDTVPGRRPPARPSTQNGGSGKWLRRVQFLIRRPSSSDSVDQLVMPVPEQDTSKEPLPWNIF